MKTVGCLEADSFLYYVIIVWNAFRLYFDAFEKKPFNIDLKKKSLPLCERLL